MARPSIYSPEIAATLCERLVEGQSLRSICRAEDMPGITTVFRWLEANETFRALYARARDAQADTLADEIIEISDDGTNDWMTRQREDGSSFEVVDHEHITRSKLRVDARKWIAAKLKPRKYGEKVDLTNSDGSFSGAFARLIAEEGGVERDSRGDPQDAGARSG